MPLNILLVNQVLGTTVRPIVPLGLCSIATFVEHFSSHVVRVFDPNTNDDWRACLRALVAVFPPHVVGISFRNSDSTLFLDRVNYFPGLKRLAREVRDLCPSAILVVGGAGASVFPREILEKIPQVDGCVCGPGEESMLCLADAPGDWSAVPGGVYRAEDGAGVRHSSAGRTMSFGTLPFPRREYVPMERYVGGRDAVGVLTRQGCGHQCLYCVYPAASGRTVVGRAPEHVVEELEYLVRDYGVEHVYLADNQFNEPVESMVDLCEAMIRRRVPVRWTAFFNCRAGGMDRSLLSLVRRAGCVRVQASPEAYPQRYLDVFGRYSEAEVRAFVDLLGHQHEIEGLLDFFVEAPGQRWSDFFRMLSFIVRQVAWSGWTKAPVTYKLHAIRIYPGTALFRRAVETGFLPEGADLLPDTEKIDESLYYLTPGRKAIYRFLIAASRLVGYRTPDFKHRDR